MHLELQTASTADILPVAEVSAFLRVDDATQNEEIARLIRAAISRFQQQTGRQLLTATYKFYLNGFPCKPIRLPMPPTISVVSVGYYAVAGVLTTLDASAYQVAKGGVFHHLLPAPNSVWPIALSGLMNSVEIVFTCGYGTTREAFDEDLIHSLKVLVAHWYENREAGELPDFIIDLWRSWNTGELG